MGFILPISDINGEKSYRAIAENKYSLGKTAGQALDALTAQLDEMEFSAEQEQLSELMNLWRSARAQGRELSPEQQAELNSLVEIELRASAALTGALMQ